MKQKWKPVKDEFIRGFYYFGDIITNPNSDDTPQDTFVDWMFKAHRELWDELLDESKPLGYLPKVPKILYKNAPINNGKIDGEFIKKDS